MKASADFNGRSARDILVPVLALTGAMISLCVGTSFATTLFPDVLTFAASA